MPRTSRLPVEKEAPPASFGAKDGGPPGIGRANTGRVRLGRGRGLDKIVIVFVPVALFIYQSLRPVYRLRAEMPPRFPDSSSRAPGRAQAAEKRVAMAYWNCGVAAVQWKYAYGSPLPADPPPEFRIDQDANHDASSPRGKLGNEETRARYWNRLRQLWVSPDAWTSYREWSTAWLTEPIYKFVDRSEYFFQHLWDSA